MPDLHLFKSLNKASKRHNKSIKNLTFNTIRHMYRYCIDYCIGIVTCYIGLLKMNFRSLIKIFRIFQLIKITNKTNVFNVIVKCQNSNKD